mmetsp:Transcript_141957/g.344806  ORF Transcript_141957/g.344806 Transcript_141957/m.344806 type:complete len:319 (+) Transcript_141957:527-1483(+)
MSPSPRRVQRAAVPRPHGAYFWPVLPLLPCKRLAAGGSVRLPRLRHLGQIHARQLCPHVRGVRCHDLAAEWHLALGTQADGYSWSSSASFEAILQRRQDHSGGLLSHGGGMPSSARAPPDPPAHAAPTQTSPWAPLAKRSAGARIPRARIPSYALWTNRRLPSGHPLRLRLERPMEPCPPRAPRPPPRARSLPPPRARPPLRLVSQARDRLRRPPLRGRPWPRQSRHARPRQPGRRPTPWPQRHGLQIGRRMARGGQGHGGSHRPRPLGPRGEELATPRPPTRELRLMMAFQSHCRCDAKLQSPSPTPLGDGAGGETS